VTTAAEGRTLRRTVLALKLATTEFAGRPQRLAEPFHSIYGEGVVPLLVDDGEARRGIYVDVVPWTPAAKEECLRWLGLLRASELEDLAMEIRSDGPVPADITFFSGRSPRIDFELLGLLQVRVFGHAGFAAANATNLRRLSAEYLDLQLRDGQAGLQDLDRLVVEVLRADGHILPSTILLLGCFFGEALGRMHGGRWNVAGPTSDQVTVEVATPGGVLAANVFGKVTKLFHNGIEDSTYAMALAIEARRESI
jgi:hypothetical protein